MGDMSPVIVPRSDQLNSDSLIAGPITIRISAVNIAPGTEQPVAVSFDGDNGKPWKPCKSMARILVSAWGPDSSKYIGRSLTLYRDPKVKWGGLEVGGIRISHMSDIPNTLTLALTETRANRKPFTVQPLKAATPPRQPPQTPLRAPDDTGDLSVWADEFDSALDGMTDLMDARARINAAVTSPEYERLKTSDPYRKAQLAAKAEGLLKRLKAGT